MSRLLVPTALALALAFPFARASRGLADTVADAPTLACDGEVWVTRADAGTPRMACHAPGDRSGEQRLRASGFRPMRPIPVITGPSTGARDPLVVELDREHQELRVRDARGRVRYTRSLDVVSAPATCCGLSDHRAECGLYAAVTSAWTDPDTKLVAIKLETNYPAAACGIEPSIALYALAP